MRASDLAWVALGAGVIAYDVLAAENEMLSEAADRYMLAHPWLTRAAAFTVAAHLCNVVPPRADPIHLLFGLKHLSRRHR